MLTSQPVMVVPTLAPNTTASAWRSDRIPALTKPMVATVTALDDCTSAVIDRPVSAPRMGLAVHRESSARRCAPPAIFSPSVIIVIASRNKARPPATVNSAVMGRKLPGQRAGMRPVRPRAF